MSQLQSTNDTGAANGDSRASCGEQESIGLQQDVDPDTTQGFLDVQEHGHATELISKCVAPIDGIDKVSDLEDPYLHPLIERGTSTQPVSMEESGDHDTAEYDLNGLSHDTEQNAHGGHDQGKNAERRERESTHDVSFRLTGAARVL